MRLPVIALLVVALLALAAGADPEALATIAPVVLVFVAAWRRFGENRAEWARHWFARRRASAPARFVAPAGLVSAWVPRVSVMGRGLARRPPPSMA